MKLRNKKTGDIWVFEDGFVMNASYETAKRAGVASGSLTCYAGSITELNEEWEDYEEPVKSKYYLRNKETGYVASFETKDEQMCFYNALDDWERVYITTEPCGEKD